MPDRFPKAKVEIADLGIFDGAPVLLRRGVAQLAAGELLEVAGDSPALADGLAAWCRKEGHRYLGRGSGPHTYRVERGAKSAPLTAEGAQIAEAADPRWGLAPRGARIEAGGPEFAFTLLEKREVWAEGLASIYKQAVGNQWSAARDIPWERLPALPPEVESAVGQIMTFLTENEFAALYVPARFIPRIHPHYREVVEVLAVQIVDEARHAEAFTRRAQAGGEGLGTTAVSGQLSLQTLLEEPDFTTATFLLCVMGEGTFLTLLKFIEEHAPDAVTAVLARLAHRDEARHVAFGMEHLRYVLAREPERRSSLAAAVERRSRMLAAVSGLSPYVHDALTVAAGGGISPDQIRVGARHVAGLHREMDRARRERLQSLGFGAEEAGALSVYHTKNFM
ncbi:MAG TPA: ferritin-like domain-containing protein [Terriglobia bacterium]|nr:ferritin-like domain-containing protein [Terriglobia bacterium]